MVMMMMIMIIIIIITITITIIKENGNLDFKRFITIQIINQ